MTVARLSPEKDIANLVRATAMAAEWAPELRVEVAGGGPCLAVRAELACTRVRRGASGTLTAGKHPDLPAVKQPNA